MRCLVALVLGLALAETACKGGGKGVSAGQPGQQPDSVVTTTVGRVGQTPPSAQLPTVTIGALTVIIGHTTYGEMVDAVGRGASVAVREYDGEQLFVTCYDLVGEGRRTRVRAGSEIPLVDSTRLTLVTIGGADIQCPRDVPLVRGPIVVNNGISLGMSSADLQVVLGEPESDVTASAQGRDMQWAVAPSPRDGEAQVLRYPVVGARLLRDSLTTLDLIQWEEAKDGR